MIIITFIILTPFIMGHNAIFIEYKNLTSQRKFSLYLYLNFKKWSILMSAWLKQLIKNQI